MLRVKCGLSVQPSTGHQKTSRKRDKKKELEDRRKTVEMLSSGHSKANIIIMSKQLWLSAISLNKIAYY